MPTAKTAETIRSLARLLARQAVAEVIAMMDRQAEGDGTAAAHHPPHPGGASTSNNPS